MNSWRNSSIIKCFSISRRATAALCAAAFLAAGVLVQAQHPLLGLHHHVRPVVANGEARLVGRLPSGQRLNLSLTLPLRNEAELRSLLSRLYDPSSPDYRKFLSVAEFTEKFGPTAEDFKAVVDFAKASGFSVTDEPANRMTVPVSATAEQIERAFNVKMNVYQHPTEDRVFYSPDAEPSPALGVPLTHIAGLNSFSKPHRAASALQAEPAGVYQASGPNGIYLGSDMQAAYYGGTVLTGVGQVVGLFEFGGYNMSDVTKSFTSAGQTEKVPVNNVVLDGADPGAGGGDGETVLDIVGAIGMAPGLSQVRVYIGSNDADIFNKMAEENIAKQISVSWLWSPDDPDTDEPIFAEMASQGQTIFAASGDGGSYAESGGSIAYPAEDPWVTAVGGTLLPAYTLPWPEVAWGTGYCTGVCASTGGVSPDGISMADWSAKYNLPNYQAGVANSLNGGSAFLRNIPDVAANGGSGIYSCPLGQCSSWVGTSLASPLWAAFTALVNQQATAAGRPTVGFINPAIYAIGKSASYTSDFHDITSGSNGAFGAVTGYDLVTGWGSPNGQNFINALAGAPLGPSSSCHVTYTIESQWSGAFNTSITIHNDSAINLEGWTLTWSFADGQTVAQSWGGNVTQSGSTVTAYNPGTEYGPLPAGASYSGLGFNGTWNNSVNAVPAMFTLNGTVCK